MGGSETGKADSTVRLRNLTPHAVMLRTATGALVELPPEPVSARVQVDAMPAGTVATPEGSVPLVREHLGGVVGLPSAQPGVLHVVSRVVLDACPERSDLVCPGDFERGDDGRIRAAGALVVGSRPPETAPAPDHLVVLAGGNPMPNLQAIVTLSPRKVTILASQQTAQLAQRTADAARTVDRSLLVSTIRVGDANDRVGVEAALRGVEPGWALCYSGGTKVMTAAARLLYDELGDRRPRHAFVADGRLRRDDGTEVPLAPGVALRTIAVLHGHRLSGGHGPRVRLSRLVRAASALAARARSPQPGEGITVTLGDDGKPLAGSVSALLEGKGGTAARGGDRGGQAAVAV